MNNRRYIPDMPGQARLVTTPLSIGFGFESTCSALSGSCFAGVYIEYIYLFYLDLLYKIVEKILFRILDFVSLLYGVEEMGG